MGEITLKLWKRLSALLVLAALAAALTVPGLAAPETNAAVSSFGDVTDPVVGRNADILRLMGVVQGTGGDNFDPNGSLTRAQFCIMVIRIMGLESQVAGQMNRTVFQDVGPIYWARGYINLASTIKIGDSLLIRGNDLGEAEPEANISFAQAVTIIIRALGYEDAAVGSVWPSGHIAKAAELGLSKDVSASADQSITRAQAAQLFVNLLTSDTAAGQPFHTTLGSAREGVILFGADGSGNVRTSEGDFALPMQLPASMKMRQGLLIVSGGNRIAAFLPGEAGVAVTLSAQATEKYLKTERNTYSVADDARVFIPNADGPNGSVETKTYTDFCSQLDSGARLTAYFTDGKVSELYLHYAGSGSLSPAGDAVIITGAATEATFYQLTGGASGMRIVKDGSAIAMSDLKPNDVVTYNAVTNTLTASGLRIPTVYNAATPNLRTPETIRIAGLDQELEVLPCAAEALSRYRLGDSFTVLLTADAKVAGVLPASSQAGSTAVGVWDGSTVSVHLAGGETLEFSAASSIPAGQLVTVSAYSRKEASVSRVTSRTIPGDFDVRAMTLGEYTVAADAVIYERWGASGKALKVADLSALMTDVVPAGKVSVYHLNTSDMVDALVLDNVTGNTYSYGILRQDERMESSTGMLSATNRTALVENSSNTNPSGGPITGLVVPAGSFGGMVADASGNRVLDIVLLNAVSGVTAKDFFTLNGVQYVTAGGRVYRLAVDAEGKLAVECYNSNVKEPWSSGEKAVEEIKNAYNTGLTIYVDPTFNVVRVICAN